MRQPARVLHTSVDKINDRHTLDLGIKAFKRAHKGDHKAMKAYKVKQWKG